MNQKITSPSNSRIKDIVRLRQRKYRDQHRLSIVEGVTEITRLLESSVRTTDIFVCLDYLTDASKAVYHAAIQKDIPVTETSPAVYEKIAFGDRHDGLLMLIEYPTQTLEQIKATSQSLFVVLEKVEKPGNLGAVLRTADAVGAQGLFICDPGTDMYNPNVIRASLGTVFSVPTATGSAEDVVEYLNKNQIKIYAAVVDADKIYFDVDWRSSAAVVLGSEHDGLTPFWKEHADATIRIPMQGRADSLNVSASAAVILYEACRQKVKSC